MDHQKFSVSTTKASSVLLTSHNVPYSESFLGLLNVPSITQRIASSLAPNSPQSSVVMNKHRHLT